MKPDMMKRYLILLAVLVICAGAAWYFTNASAKPAQDAVLAYLDNSGDREEKQGYTVQINTAEYVNGGARIWQAKSFI